MTRKFLMAGVAACGLILAAAAMAAENSSPGGTPDAQDHHGRWDQQETPDAMAARLMERFDLNKDGKITKAEIEKAIKDKVDARFAAADANHDGAISEEEFYQAAVAHLREHTDRLFKLLDKNGDGKLTPDEALAMHRMMMHHMMMGEGIHGFDQGGSSHDEDGPPTHDPDGYRP